MSRSFLARLLRSLVNSFIAYGEAHCQPPGTAALPLIDLSPVDLQGPPPGHPERLRPDLPLSALERALEQQI